MNLNNFKKFNSKEKNIYKIIILLVIGFFIFYFFIYNSIPKINNLSKEIIDKKIELEREYLQIKNEGKLLNQLRSIEPKMNILNNVFLNKNRELEFVNTLEGIADKNNVSQTIKPFENSNKTNNTFHESPLSLEATGSFNNLIAYIKNIEALSYYINIDKLTISESSQSESREKKFFDDLESVSDNKNLNLVISSKIYWKNYENENQIKE